MKITQIKSLLLFVAISLVATSCSVTTDPVEALAEIEASAQISLTKMETSGSIYSEITFTGKSFGGDCTKMTVSLENSAGSTGLEIKECSDTSVTAWIPADMEAGDYDVTLEVNGTSFSDINGEDLQATITLRPVILTMSATEIVAGGTLDITGLHLLNTSGDPVNNPKVWLMKIGSTNTVSEITVNDDGTAASIVIDSDIAKGLWSIKLTCEEWSNEYDLTIL
tara:strand:- start:1354 stop:2025 length:672 start_codon:yes stop_codon:yes gene_type:complete